MCLTTSICLWSQHHNILCLLYGDPAYPLRPQLLGHFNGAGVTQIQQDWNQTMSKFRINVEWIFGDTLNYFKFLDFKKGLKLSAIGKMYLVCAILQNAHACLHGNKTSKYFGLQPVNIADYFQWRSIFLAYSFQKYICL